MAEIYLITQADIVLHHPMSTGIVQARFDPYILKAQELDLKPVLNDALYYDFLTKFSNTGDPMYALYHTLLNGGAFALNGVTINYPGIKPMLCAFVMARFLPANQNNVTRYGVTQKTTPQSEPVSASSITYLVNNLRAEAMAYQNQVEQYLLQKQTDYPLYGRYPSSVKQRTGVRFTNSARGTQDSPGFHGWWNGNYYP